MKTAEEELTEILSKFIPFLMILGVVICFLLVFYLFDATEPDQVVERPQVYAKEMKDYGCNHLYSRSIG